MLNLDTTAVLLTPVFLALGERTEVAPLPLAMTWLANTASLLPVSNLTNLVAADRIGRTPSPPVYGRCGWRPSS